MQIKYFGHSCFLLKIGKVRIIIDPYLKENPHGSVDPKKVPCEFALVTHAHSDHLGDAAELAKIHGAKLVAPYELAAYLATKGASVIDLLPGGGVNLPWGRITMTPAIHSSSLELSDDTNRPMGAASGFVVNAKGKSVYHAGDTALFSDMSLIGRHGLDVAMIPIGDFYTMGIDDAVDALDFLRPKLAIPMHYNSDEKTQVDPREFKKKAENRGHRVKIMKVGEVVRI